MSKPPLPLDALLEAMAGRGVFQHLSVMHMGDGQFQASFRDATGKPYNVAIKTSITQAIYDALAPDQGTTWEELLGDDDLEDVL
jgi:hypothetical protein